MSATTGDSLPITMKEFTVSYKNEYDQVDTIKATLVHTNTDGFLVFRQNDKVILIPKERILVMRMT